MVTSFLKITIPPKRKKDAIQTVRSIVGWTCVQPGCISMALYQDTDSQGTMMLLEEWEDWSSIEKHIRSDSYRNILELMELSSAQPEIKFCSVSDTKGMAVPGGWRQRRTAPHRPQPRRRRGASVERPRRRRRRGRHGRPGPEVLFETEAVGVVLHGG